MKIKKYLNKFAFAFISSEPTVHDSAVKHMLQKLMDEVKDRIEAVQTETGRPINPKEALDIFEWGNEKWNGIMLRIQDDYGYDTTMELNMFMDAVRQADPIFFEAADMMKAIVQEFAQNSTNVIALPNNTEKE